MLCNYWYIACAATQLGADPRAAEVLDQELVLFRGRHGAVHTLLDRCCHRGTRLSLGEVMEETLACRYHGWRYDGTGRCVHIPSLIVGQRIPKGCDVPAFPCREQDGYIWVWMGGPGTHLTPLPGIPDFQQYGWLQGSIVYRCEALRVIENNLDWCHAAFVHPGSHPHYTFVKEHGFTRTAYEMRLHAQGLVVFAPPTASEDAPIPETPMVMIRFDLPNRVRVDMPRAGLIIFIHVVPTGVNTCQVEWLMHEASMGRSGVTWTDEEPEVFAQDRCILESAQPWYDRDRRDFERSVEADACTLLVRRIVALAEQGRWEEKRSSLPQRRIVPVRA